MRCKPGDLCVIVAESPGCECNIGAMVRVTEIDPVVPEGWRFIEASRPIRLSDTDYLGLPCEVDYVSRWNENPAFDALIYDQHLVPVPPPTHEESTSAVKELSC